MSRQDDVAAKAVRKSTLKSIKTKKKARIKQLKKDYENNLREIELEYSENPERLKAKFAAEDFAKSEKAKNKAARRIEKEKKLIELQKNDREYTTGENISNAILQGIGAALYVAAVTILETIGVCNLKDYEVLTTVFFALFGATMILMYIFSVLRYSLVNIRAREVFNRLTHVFAYISIGVGYTVYSITKIQGVAGWILFGIVCAIVLAEIIMYSISGPKYEIVATVLCGIAGFSGVVLSKNLYMALSPKSFSMLCSAAGCYLVGLVFYNMNKIKYMRLISNIFMLAGGVLVFFSMLFI